jgi:hypothetical protein
MAWSATAEALGFSTFAPIRKRNKPEQGPGYVLDPWVTGGGEGLFPISGAEVEDP